MALSPLEIKLGEATRGNSVAIMGFDDTYNTLLALRTISERVEQGERVLYISSEREITHITELLNENLIRAQERGRLVISSKIKVEKIWVSAERIGATTVVLDSIYTYKLNFPKKPVEYLVAEAVEKGIRLVLTHPIDDQYRSSINQMISDNTAVYLVRDRLIKTMGAVWLTYETAEGIHLRTMSKSKKLQSTDMRINITKESLFL